MLCHSSGGATVVLVTVVAIVDVCLRSLALDIVHDEVPGHQTKLRLGSGKCSIRGESQHTADNFGVSVIPLVITKR